MQMCACKKTVFLQLGATVFPNVCSPDEEPLEKKFKEELVRVNYPILRRRGFQIFPPIIQIKEEKGGILTVKGFNKSSRAENFVTNAFFKAFSQLETKGLMIPHYHSSSFLQPFIKKAKDQRESFTTDDVPLTEYEQKLSEALAMKEDLAMLSFLSVILCLDSDLSHKVYSKELQQRCHETDIVTVLEKEEVFLVIETKSCEETKSSEGNKLLNALKKASTQLKKRREDFLAFHKDILCDSFGL